METVVPLVRAVIRAFYTDEHAIVVEPLLREPYYLEDDNQAKGALSKKFGWIASKIIRQRLDALVEHSLVQKKEILVTINLDTGEADTSRHKREFYYIDFVHFLKIITLRFHLMNQFVFQSKRESVVPEWTCFPDCDQGRVFSVMDVPRLRVNPVSGKFVCPNCGSDLEEKVQTSSTSSGEQSYEGVDEKLRKQLMGEVDYRDGIKEFMTRAQNAGTDLPDNDPARKLKQLELVSREKRARLQAEAAGENQEEEEDYTKVKIIAAADKEMPAWFRHTLTGETTEDAIQDDKQRKLRNKSRDGSDEQTVQPEYVKQYEQEMLAKAAAADQLAAAIAAESASEARSAPTAAPAVGSFPVFTFKSGRQVEKRPDMTQEELEELQESCPVDEYEALMTFFEL